MTLPEQLLLSDLLRRRVRCDQGLDHGLGLLAWMHPPVHRLLGWACRPSAFAGRREVWRLDQLCGLADSEVFVRGEPAVTDPGTLERLPTLIDAALTGREERPLGTVADAAVELATGRILHYLVSRSDPRLPGTSRWRLTPDRILDQQPGLVSTALESLDDLPLARASVRQDLLRRSRRWRAQMEEETGRLRDRFQQAGGQFEERLEGWLEDAPWSGEPETWSESGSEPGRRRPAEAPWPASGSDPLEDWPEPWPQQRFDDGFGQSVERGSEPAEARDVEEGDPTRREDRYRGPDHEDDPWI
ncbi:MAG: RNA methyltransferase [Cyanobacteriota bacterium]|nr:RNA methyltransferase [Cyanobacteriota bacterium]